MLKSQVTEQQIEEWRESLYEQVDKENNQQDINNVIDRLCEVINKPILINICNKTDLEQLPFLSERQIENLLYYRYAFGELKSLHELRMVEDFDLETIRRVTPFLRVEPVGKVPGKPVDNLFVNPRQQVLIRYDRTLNKKEGYVDKSDSLLMANPNKKYLGDPSAAFVRYRLDCGNRLLAGLVAAKDAGEKGVDYLNGFVQLKNVGMVRNLVTGSYKMRLGAGLVINNSFSLGKSQMGASMLMRTNGISPHASTDEYNYLRGIATELKMGRYALIAFWSYRSLDAIVEGDTILSIKKDGLHSLQREKLKKDRADLISGGASLSGKWRWMQVGVNGAYHVFNSCYYPEMKLYNRYAFRGRRLANVSVDYRLKQGRFAFAGETAMGDNGAFAVLNMLSCQPTSGLAVTLLQRYYGRDYYTWFGRSYSEGSELNNESGISLLAEAKPLPGLRLEGGVDIFRFAWPKYGIDIPSSGYEFRFQGSYQQGSKWGLNLLYVLKNKEKNRSGVTENEPSVQSYQQHRIGMRLTAVISSSVFLKTAVEGSFFRFEKESASKGMLLSQSVGYKAPGGPLQVDVLVALFDTDDTSVRMYLSEKNVLYGFGIPSFYGNGMRSACNLRYDIGKRITFWLKIANTHYFDRDEIGSGLELIRGKNKTDLSAQLQVKF